MEEMTRIILAYEKDIRELKDAMKEAFGSDDEDTQRVTAQWLAVEELLIILNLKPL